VKNPLVSIVTPVYNGAGFIAECIRSVQAQDYDNWEYTVVDNRSADSTGDIVRTVAKGDSRVRLVTNKNFVPMVVNWNLAIAQVSAEAKYFKPLMADDWLAPHCISTLVDAAERRPEVGIVCSYAFDGCKVLWDGFPFTGDATDMVSFAPGSDVARESLLGGPYVFGTPTSGLFRADIVRSRRPFYDEGNLHADHASCYDVLTESDFAFVHQVLSLNRVHAESQTTSVEMNDAMILGSLSALAKFGPKFLSEREFQARMNQRLTGYYRLLGRNVLRGRGKSFWSLHRRRMNEIGMPISRPRLAVSVVREFLTQVRHPISAGRNVWRCWVCAR
jgi:glycosyltransferase involved in cell wall biosynthesis